MADGRRSPKRPRATRQPDATPIGPKVDEKAPKTHEARVRAVMALIAGGKWIEDGSSRRELAAEWGISEHTVTRLVAEAQRRVAAVDEGDFIRKRMCTAIDEAVDEAMVAVRSGDVRALTGLANLARAWSEYGGVKPKGGATDDVPVFRVELTAAPADPCPAPSGPSSPPAGDPAPG